MAKRGSGKGNMLRKVAAVFDREGRNRLWADSVKRLHHEATAADNEAAKRKRRQFARLRSIERK